MSVRHARLRAGGVLAAVAGLLATGVATGAAEAAGPTGYNAVFLASASNGNWGIYRAAADNLSTRTTVLSPAHVDVSRAILSPDGTRIAATVDPLAGTSKDNFDYSLQIMNLDGSNRHTVFIAKSSATTTAFSIDMVTGFGWTPDSSSVVYGSLHYSSTSGNAPSYKLARVPAAGGTATTLSGSANLVNPSIGADGTIVAISTNSGDLVTYDTSTHSTHTVVAGGTASFFDPAVSPDGTQIAYAQDTSTNTADSSELNVITKSGSTWSTPVTAVATSGSWVDEAPVWAPDGTLWFDRYDDSSNLMPGGDLWSTSLNGTSWTAANNETGDAKDEMSVTFGAVDTTAPGAATFHAFRLAGTTTEVKWTPPADVDYSHVVITRDSGSGPVQVYSGRGPSFLDKTATVGHTYTYSITAYDGAGNQQTLPASTRQVTALNAPKMVVSNPTSATTTRTPFAVKWGVSNPAGTKYDVQSTVRGGTNWALQSPTNWFTSSTTGHATYTKAALGRTYYFRARVNDAYGNTSGFTPYSVAAVPLDQKSGSFSTGWKTLALSSTWQGSYARTAHNGSSARFTATGKRLQLIGMKCSACGSFKVYVGGVLRGTYSAHAATTKQRQVLWTGSWTTIAKRSVKVVAVLSGGRSLRVDGFTAQR